MLQAEARATAGYPIPEARLLSVFLTQGTSVTEPNGRRYPHTCPCSTYFKKRPDRPYVVDALAGCTVTLLGSRLGRGADPSAPARDGATLQTFLPWQVNVSHPGGASVL